MTPRVVEMDSPLFIVFLIVDKGFSYFKHLTIRILSTMSLLSTWGAKEERNLLDETSSSKLQLLDPSELSSMLFEALRGTEGSKLTYNKN